MMANNPPAFMLECPPKLYPASKWPAPHVAIAQSPAPHRYCTWECFPALAGGILVPPTGSWRCFDSLAGRSGWTYHGCRRAPSAIQFCAPSRLPAPWAVPHAHWQDEKSVAARPLCVTALLVYASASDSLRGASASCRARWACSGARACRTLRPWACRNPCPQQQRCVKFLLITFAWVLHLLAVVTQPRWCRCKCRGGGGGGCDVRGVNTSHRRRTTCCP